MSEENKVTRKAPLTADQIIKRAKEMQEAKAKRNQGGNFPNVTFLPEGDHVVRIFQDPHSELYREERIRGYFNYAHVIPDECKNWPEDKDPYELDPICEELSEYRIWKYNVKDTFMFYCHVISTNNTNENWKPGETYIVLGDWRAKNAFQDFIIGVSDDSPEILAQCIDPGVEGPGVGIMYNRDGQKTSLTITPKFNKSPPVELDDKYIPLSQAYVRAEYIEENYSRLKKKATEELKATRAARKAKGQPLLGEDGFEESKENENPQKETKESKSEDKSNDSTSTPESEKKEEPIVEEKQEDKQVDKSSEPAASDANDKWSKFKS